MLLYMTAIPHAAGAPSSALGRFERASMRRLEAAIGAGEDEEITPVSATTGVQTRTRPGSGGAHFSDQLWKALIEAQADRGPE